MQTYKLGEIIDILDNQRIPISSSEREKRISGKSEKDLIPYYGATQQNGWIDDYIFNEELVLLGEDGVLFYDEDKPKAYIIRGKSRVNNHAHVIRGKEGIVLNNYLCYFLNKFDYHGYVTGATRLKLNQSAMKDIPINLPLLATQRAIADKLDKLQSLIDLKKQAITKTDELAKSIFLEMFGDTVTNEKRWEVKILGDLCDVGSSKRVFVEELVEKGVPFYRGTEIGKLSENDTIEPSLFITQDHYEKLKEQTGVPKIGDLLMPSICPDGRIFRVTDDKPFYFKDGRVLWIKVNESKVNSIYLKSLLKEIFYADYSNIASGTTFAELKIFALKKIKILFPPLPLQQKFANIITQIEAKKSEHKLALAKLEELYQAEMQRSFSL